MYKIDVWDNKRYEFLFNNRSVEDTDGADGIINLLNDWFGVNKWSIKVTDWKDPHRVTHIIELKE